MDKMQEPVGFTVEMEGNKVGEGPVRAVLHPSAAFSLPPRVDLYAEPQAKAAPAWVSCAERLPTAEEADCMGNVWVLWSHDGGSKGRVQIATWQATRFAEVSHWAPTGLVRPEPPAEEA